MIAVTCRKCRQDLEVPDTRAGMEVLCKCGTRVKVPKGGEDQTSEMAGFMTEDDRGSVGHDREAMAPGRWTTDSE